MKHLIAAARERRDARYGAQYGVRLPTELAVHIVREVCSALEYAHDLEDTDQGLPLNIVHRDISPQNVLVSFDGEVKLTDFGIAKARDSGEHTQVGVVK
jgi:serine/threonine-protein kinase